MNTRSTGGVIVFSVMAVLGVIGLATGHEDSGLVALVIGGPMLIATVARLARRRLPSHRAGQAGAPGWRSYPGLAGGVVGSAVSLPVAWFLMKAAIRSFS